MFFVDNQKLSEITPNTEESEFYTSKFNCKFSKLIDLGDRYEDNEDRHSSKVPDFQPKLPTDLIPDLDNKDKYLFERIDVLTQSMNWQNDKMFDLQRTVDCYVEDTESLKNLELPEQSSSLESAINEVKSKTTSKLRKYTMPFVALFLGILYPAYLEAYSDLGSKVIKKYYRLI